MSERDFDELSAGDALHALTPDDERALRDALATDPALQERLDADREAASLLAERVPEVVPPAGIRDALLARIAVTPQDAPPPPDASSQEGARPHSRAGDERPHSADADARPHSADARPYSGPETGGASPHSAPEDTRPHSAGGSTPSDAPRRGWGTRAWFALAACLVLIIGIGGAVAVVSQQLNRPEPVVALERIESAADAQSAAATVDGGGEAVLHWSPSLGEAVLVSDDLPTIPEDKTYELWYLRDGEPISAGVFAVDDGDATAILGGEMHEGDTIAITVEPSGGAPGGIPTGSPIVAIAT
ncbi:anti-sigma factor [Microbacterium caowuchunii]|uniref:Regulator of SigK n=1 Tax=Microbacterium caowuchunii TaxID=2614638 RepID=A0A5N0T896_9MICO|nr:anti-sigma factor [Microbacterium caowuchunii]KAA9131142.1 anti-sigma factor [Microbacterium caowuchunii]